MEYLLQDMSEEVKVFFETHFNEFIPEITPDPVFAFNQNASHLLPSKEELENLDSHNS